MVEKPSSEVGVNRMSRDSTSGAGPTQMFLKKGATMKKLFLIPAFVMAFPVGVAFAQTPDATTGSSSSMNQTSDGAMKGGMQHADTGMMAKHHNWMKHHNGMNHHWMGHPMGGPMMMGSSKAAFFRFQRGDSSMTIKCAENESTQACVTAATTLMQEMHKLKSSAPSQ